MRTILFVCSGNLARSPMAEYLLKARLKELGEDDVRVQSAGTIATDGNRAAYDAMRLFADRGIDMRPHRARRLTGKMVHDADQVVVMERYHRDVARDMAPYAEDNIVLMSDFLKGREGMEIPDPYGGPREEFVEAFELIEEAVYAIADQLAHTHERTENS